MRHRPSTLNRKTQNRDHCSIGEDIAAKKSKSRKRKTSTSELLQKKKKKERLANSQDLLVSLSYKLLFLQVVKKKHEGISRSPHKEVKFIASIPPQKKKERKNTNSCGHVRESRPLRTRPEKKNTNHQKKTLRNRKPPNANTSSTYLTFIFVYPRNEHLGTTDRSTAKKKESQPSPNFSKRSLACVCVRRRRGGGAAQALQPCHLAR